MGLLVAAPAVAGEKYKGFERGDALITVAELKKMMDAKDPKLVLLAVAKTVDYRLGHIPGAHQVWRPDYEPKESEPYPFEGMMLNRAEFQEFARSLGIDNDSKVVIYDHKYDATRLWWGFYLYGKTDTRVLDGGYQAWKAAGHDTDILAPDDPKPGSFVAKGPLPGWNGTMYDVWTAKTSPDWQVWDTRANSEWTGEKLKKGAYRKGRIGWSTFQEWKEFKMPIAEGENPTAFKTAADIEEVVAKFGMDKNKHQIFYCQSGVRTTTNIFALYLLGWDVSKLHNYDGSWIEWSYFEKNPVVCEKCE
jgi:thiosulfate/3-mercaptopyruvate sulfurtransferase